MKKVIERLNRVLAILLVAAMVVGSVPEMGLVARAEGTTDDGTTSDDDATTGDVGSDGTTTGEAEAQDLGTPDADPADQGTPSGEQSEPGSDKTEATVSSGDAQDTPTPTPVHPDTVDYDDGGGANATIKNATISAITNFADGKITALGTDVAITVAPNAGYMIEDAKAQYGLEGSATKTALTVGTTGSIYKFNANSITVDESKGEKKTVRIYVDATPIQYGITTHVIENSGATVSVKNSATAVDVEHDYEFTVTAKNDFNVGTVKAELGKMEGEIFTKVADATLTGVEGAYTLRKENLKTMITTGATDRTKTYKLRLNVATAAAPKNYRVNYDNTKLTITYTNDGTTTPDASKTPMPVNEDVSVASDKKLQLYIAPKAGYKLKSAFPSTFKNVELKAGTGTGVYEFQTGKTSVDLTGTDNDITEKVTYALTAQAEANSYYSLSFKGGATTATYGEPLEFTVGKGEKFAGGVSGIGVSDTKDASGQHTSLTISDLEKVNVDADGWGTYRIPGDYLKNPATGVSLGFTVNTYAYKAVVKCPANVTVKYITKGTLEAADVADTVVKNGAMITVPSGGGLRLSATLNDALSSGQMIYMNGDDGNVDSGNSKLYTFADIPAVDSDGVGIPANKALVFTIASSETKVALTETNNNSTVKYLYGCVTNDSGKKVVVGADIKFEVTPNENYGIQKVTYKLTSGGGTEEQITAGTDGSYTVPGSAVTGAMTITVYTGAVRKTGKYTLNFHTDNKASYERTVNGTKVTDDSCEVEVGKAAPVVIKPTTGNEILYVSVGGPDGNKLTGTGPTADGTMTYSLKPDCDGLTLYVKTRATNRDVTLEKETTKWYDYQAKEVFGSDKAYYIGSDSTKVVNGTNTVKAGESTKITIDGLPAEYKIRKVECSYPGIDANDWTKGIVSNISGNTFEIKVEENAKLRVFVELNESNSNVWKVTYTQSSEDGRADTAKVEIDDLSGVEIKSPHLTTGTRAVTITARAGYELVEVKKAGSADLTITAGDTTVTDSSVTANVSYTIKTKLTALTADKAFTVENNSRRLKYTVDLTGVTKSTETSYTLNSGATALNFSVTAQAGVTPVVKKVATGGGSVDLTGTKGTGNTWTYMVPASQVAASDKIVMDDNKEAVSIAIADLNGKYSDDSSSTIDAVVKVNDVTMTADSRHMYWAEYGDFVEIEITPKGSFEIKELTRIENGQSTAVENVSRVTFTAGDNNIVFKAKTVGVKGIEIKDSSDNVVTATNGKYVLGGGMTYTASVKSGSDNEAISKGKLMAGRTVKSEISASGSVVTFTTPNESTEQNLTLVMCDSSDKEVGRADLRISAGKATLKLGGKTAPTDTPLELEVYADSTTEYKISAGAMKLSDIEAAIKSTDQTGWEYAAATPRIVVDADRGVLVVDAPSTVGTTGTSAEVSLYNKNLGSTTGLLGKVKFKTVEVVAVKNANVSVSQVAGTKDSLVMKIAGPKSLPELDGDYYWYKITYDSSSTGATPTSGTAYVKWAGAATEAVVKVYTPTTGYAVRDYNVKAQLLQLADECTAPSSSNVPTATQTLTEGKTMANAVVMKTRAEQFADKVNLKIVNGTVYTGQTDVVVAVPVYDKNKAPMLIAGATDARTGEITLTPTNTSGFTTDIKATVARGAALGKHTITVTGTATDTSQAPTKTITLNVARGIEEIALTAPAEEIYKPNGKAASMKLTAVLNGGASNRKPAKASVRYTLSAPETVDAADRTDYAAYLNLKVKVVASGQITVAKDTDLSRLEDGFTVQATGADYKDSAVNSNKVLIKITDEKMKLGTPVIIDGDGKVLSTAADVATNVLNGKRVVVLNDGLPVKTEHDPREYANADGMLVFSTNNAKAVEIDKDGYITVKKTAKNVTITAKTGDGSNLSKSITKINVVSQTGRPKLRVDGAKKSGTDQILNQLVAGNAEDTYNIGGSTEFTLTLYDGADAEVPYTNESSHRYGWYNYTIGVKGAKVTEKRNGQPYRIVPTAKKTEITFTDKDVKSRKFTYTLTNNEWGTKRAPSVKVSGTMPAGLRPTAQARAVTIKTAAEYKYAYVMLDKDYYDKAGTIGDNYKWLERADSEYNTATGKTLETGYRVATTNGEFTLTFGRDNTGNGDVYLPVQDYRLKIVYSKALDSYDNMDDPCAAATVTIRSASPGRVSYSPTKAYKMSLKDTPSVKLDGKATNATVTYTGIKGAIVNGAENAFDTLFQLTNGNLVFKASKATVEGLMGEKTSLKVDGYAYYSMTDAFGFTTTNIMTPISVTIEKAKATAQFKCADIEVVKGVTSADVTIMDRGKEVAIASASVTPTSFTATVTSDKITLGSIPAGDAKTYRVKLKFKVKDSLDTAAESEISANVRVVDGKKVKKNVINLTKDTVTLKSALTPCVAGAGKPGTYDTAMGGEATYTLNTIVADADISVESMTDGVEVTKEAGNKLSVKVNRTAITAATENKVNNVDVKVTFAASTGLKEQKLTLKAKYPAAAPTFEDIKAKMDANKTTLVIQSQAAKDNSDFTGKVTNVIEKALGLDTAAKKNASEVALSGLTTATTGKTDAQATSATDDGVAYRTVTLTDNTAKASDPNKTHTVAFVVRVKHSDYTTKFDRSNTEYDMDEYLDSGARVFSNNNTKVEDVISAYKEWLGLPANVRLIVTNTKKVKASDDSSDNSDDRSSGKGEISFTAQLYDDVAKANIGSSKPIKVEIPVLQTLAEVKTAVSVTTAENAVDFGKVTVGPQYKTSQNLTVLKDGILAAVKAEIENEDIACEINELTLKSGDATKATFKLKVTNPQSKLSTKEFELPGEITGLSANKSTDAIKADIKAALENSTTGIAKQVNTGAGLNSEAAIKAAIENIVKTAIGANQVTMPTVSVTNFERAYYGGTTVVASSKVKGSFKYNVKFGGSNIYATDQTVTINENDAYQTKEDLAADIKATLEGTAAVTYFSTASNWAAGKTLKYIKAQESVGPVNLVKNSAGLTVAYLQELPDDGDFKTMRDVERYTPSTAVKEGSLTATFVITESGKTKEVPVTVTLNKKTLANIGAIENELKAILEAEFTGQITDANVETGKTAGSEPVSWKDAILASAATHLQEIGGGRAIDSTAAVTVEVDAPASGDRTFKLKGVTLTTKTGVTESATAKDIEIVISKPATKDTLAGAAEDAQKMLTAWSADIKKADYTVVSGESALTTTKLKMEDTIKKRVSRVVDTGKFTVSIDGIANSPYRAFVAPTVNTTGRIKMRVTITRTGTTDKAYVDMIKASIPEETQDMTEAKEAVAKLATTYHPTANITNDTKALIIAEAEKVVKVSAFDVKIEGENSYVIAEGAGSVACKVTITPKKADGTLDTANKDTQDVTITKAAGQQG